MRSNPIRFTGMASGMDTDSIVKDLMRPQQYKIDKEKKAQALIKLKQDAWKEMNKKLYDFHRNFTNKLSMASTYNNKIISSSNPGAISIDNEAAVQEGTHTFTVTQIAESPFKAGEIKTLSGEGVKDPKLEKKITDLIKFPENKKELTLNIILNQGTAEEKQIDIKVEASDTLVNLQNKMKAQGINAKYDGANGMFFINSNKTGAKETITFTAPDVELEGELDPAARQEQRVAGRELLRQLGLLEVGKMKTTVTGKDAEYTYGSNNKKFTSSTNKIEINGIQATLKAVTTEPITISSVPNPDATYDFIKEFVTEYNNLIEELNLKLSTKPAKDIMPLTSEERESMSDSEIKLWEEKLNSSLFYKDAQLTEFVDNARSILSNQFGGDLAALGIVTGPWAERGKLHILGDKDDMLYAERPNRLREALSENPQAVADKFEEIGKKLYTDTNEKLIKGSNLKSALNFFNDKVMDDQFKSFDKRILTLEERMYKMEEMQYRKFAAMEKMLSTLNNQSSWLSQQFGGY